MRWGEVGAILAVDDDRAIRDFVQMALEEEGYGVLLAGDGAEALELLEGTRPDLILLDMRMPRVNGYQFAEAYREMPGPHAPIVVLTAANDAAGAASEIGANGYLAKPFDLEDLLRIVREQLPNGLA